MLSCMKRLEEDFVNFAINSISKYPRPREREG